MTTHPDHLVVGHLNKLHGTSGEIFVWPLTDRPDEVFVPGARVFLGDDEGRLVRIPRTDLVIETLRPHRTGLLVGFEGITDREQAGRVVGAYVLVPFSPAADRSPEEFYYHELLGLDVEGPDGRVLGRVTEVFETEPAHLLEVSGDLEALLVPLSRMFVERVDLAGGRVVLDPPAGFLELYE